MKLFAIACISFLLVHALQPLQDTHTYTCIYLLQVKEIPKFFSSLDQHLASFLSPLIEDIRSELCSNMGLLSKFYAVWKILSIESNRPDEHIYSLVIDHQHYHYNNCLRNTSKGSRSWRCSGLFKRETQIN